MVFLAKTKENANANATPSLSRLSFALASKVHRSFWIGASVLAMSACTSIQPGLSTEHIQSIVAAPDRTPADRTNDQRRMPEKMLAFIGVKPGMVVIDLFAGGGYTTELLARAIGPSGKVFGQSQPPNPNAAPPAAPEGNSNPSAAGTAPVARPAAPPVRVPSSVALAQRSQRLQAAGTPAAPIQAVVQKYESPIPEGMTDAKFDLASLMFNYHDLGHMGIDRNAMNRAIFQALKPGGVYIVSDHAGRDGTGISEAGTLHRIEEAFLRKEIESVGFKFVAEGGFLRNPNDPRDKNTPNPPQPKDDFVLKFVKP
jgi:predicted methyltransferase